MILQKSCLNNKQSKDLYTSYSIKATRRIYILKMAKKDGMSKKMVGLLITAIVFATLLPEIITSFASTALQLSGTAATIVSSILTLFIVLGFMYYIGKEMDLI